MRVPATPRAVMRRTGVHIHTHSDLDRDHLTLWRVLLRIDWEEAAHATRAPRRPPP